MSAHPRKSSLRRLHAQANSQGGYVTAKQAARVGFGYSHLAYHVHAGNLERVGHGLYRLTLIPRSEHDDLVRLALWSRDRRDEPQAVASHETALVLHGLTDLLPSSVHLTVPPRFQKPAPRGVQLHRAELIRADVEERDAFRVTTAARTLLDAARSDTVPRLELDGAVREALVRGLTRRSTLMALARTHDASTLARAVERAAKGSR